MNRRELLLTGSMSALAVMIPLPTIASLDTFDHDLPIGRIETVNEAFNILEDYQFTLSEKAELFGLYPEEFKQLDQLRDFVLDYVIDEGSRDGWARTQFLTEIRRKLNERFDGNLAAQLEWMKTREAPFSTQSLRAMMTTTRYMDVYRAVLFLGGNIA